jgi:hypothetical protein
MAQRTSILLSRRRWARRGRGLADFIIGFLVTTIEHLFQVLISAYGFVLRQVGEVFQRYRARVNHKAVSREIRVSTLSAVVQSEKKETERDAVEVLVLLGIPRPTSEKRVTRIVEIHGTLPIEELLRKALG